ncbi:ubiquilin [Nematocida ausubeli]|nr:ubiquilin [Nematocida ausubeli]
MHKVVVEYMQEVIEFEVSLDDTLDVLRQKISDRIRIDKGKIRLIHKGSALNDPGKTLSSLGVSDGSVIYASKIDKEGTEIDIVYKPEMETTGMKDPAMKKVFSNPDIMKGLLEMLPELKNENPELKKLMESSEMMEQMSKIADDPEYMNTQMKNLDIAMAKLETIPGGFNMLRGMLKTQKDPSAMLAEERDRTTFKEGSATAKPSGQPVPNPWGKYNFNPILEYRKQVEYMKECGFTDVGSNIKLLIKHHGDVDNAISEIISGSAMNSPIPDKYR